MKGRGVLEANLIVSRGDSITNYGVLGDASPILGKFYKLMHQFESMDSITFD